MKFINYYSKMRLHFKKLPRVSLYPFLATIAGVILCFFDVFDQITLSYHMQLFSVFLLIMALVYMLHTKYSMIQIPAFEYSLKLITAFELKVYVYGKVSFFSLSLMYIASSLFTFGKMTTILLFLYLIISMLVSISRRATLKEIIILILYSSFILIDVHYLLLWFIYGMVYICTDLFLLDDKQMYIHALSYSEALSMQNETAYRLQAASERIIFPSMYVNSILRFYILKAAGLTRLLLMLMLTSMLALIFLQIAGLQEFLREANIFIFILCFMVLLEKITIEDDNFIRAKLLSVQMAKYMLMLNYLLFVIFSVIFFIMMTILIAFLGISSFNLFYAAIALILVVYLIFKHAVLLKYPTAIRRREKIFLVDFVFYALLFVLFK